MTTKHTPGPWHVATNPGGPGDQPAFPSVRDSSGQPHGEDIIAMPLGDSETVNANARLIAAAPDLLAALKRAEKIVAWAQESGHESAQITRARNDARKAIAKAEGAAP